jgi:DNA-binding SARP family transcriptional activator
MSMRPLADGHRRCQDGEARPALHLLGGPYVVIDERRLEIPEGSKRLLVFIALHGGRAERKHAAGTLWPLGDDTRAAGNLRSALWRLKGAGIRLIDSDKCALTLRPDTVVDVSVIVDWAHRVIDGSPTPADLRAPNCWMDALDLLPGWYDEWVLFERERLRQRLLYALEALSVHLARAGRCGDAVEAAMAAIRVEPLRESAQRALIEAHLRAGNVVEARRSYESYRDLVERELGVPPGDDLSVLVARSGQGGAATADTARSGWRNRRRVQQIPAAPAVQL